MLFEFITVTTPQKKLNPITACMHCKKSICYLDNCICHFDNCICHSELQLLTRIVPCSSQLWAIQHTWSTGTAEVVTSSEKFAKASDKCYTQQEGIVPLQRALTIIMLAAVLIPICHL